MSEVCVRFQGVSKKYPHFLLDNISLELPEGSILGFIGANGSGKSSLINDIMKNGLKAFARTRAPSRCSAIPCPPSRSPPNRKSASSRKTCGSMAQLRWHGI